MSDSDSDDWVAPAPRKGKRKADAGAGSSRGGGQGQGGVGGKKARRKPAKAASGQQGAFNAEDPHAFVKLLSRTALEELLVRVIADQEMVTAEDARALLPAVLPDPSRPAPRPRVEVVADETSNNLGRFSRIPQTIIVGVLLRVPLKRMLSFVFAVSKGLRSLRTEPLLFRSLKGIETYSFSPKGVMRLLDSIPGRGEQVTHLEMKMNKMDSNDWITILKRCPNLQSLDIDGKKVGKQVVSVLQKTCSKVTWLALPKKISHGCAPEMWTLLKSMPELRVLKFFDFALAESTVEKLVATLTQARGGIPLLEELHCSQWKGGVDWKVFSTLGGQLPELKKITMEVMDPSVVGSGWMYGQQLRSHNFDAVPGMVFKPMLQMEMIKIMAIGRLWGPPHTALKTEALSFFLERLLAAVPNIKTLQILHGPFDMVNKDRKARPHLPALPDLNGVFTRCPPLLHLEDLELGEINVGLEDFAPPCGTPQLRTLKLRNCGPHAPAAAKAFFDDKLEVFSKGQRRCFGECGCQVYTYQACTHATFAKPAGLIHDLHRFRRLEEVAMETPDVDL